MTPKARVGWLLVTLFLMGTGDVLVFVHDVPSYFKPIGAVMLVLSGWFAGMAVFGEDKKMKG